MLFCRNAVSKRCRSQFKDNETYVDSPELFNAVEADDLFQQLVPVLLAARRLGEPQSPGVLKLVLHVEVGRVVENSDDLAVGARAIGGSLVLLVALGRNGNGVERDRLSGLGGDFGHVCGRCRRRVRVDVLVLRALEPWSDSASSDCLMCEYEG